MERIEEKQNPLRRKTPDRNREVNEMKCPKCKRKMKKESHTDIRFIPRIPWYRYICYDCNLIIPKEKDIIKSIKLLARTRLNRTPK